MRWNVNILKEFLKFVRKEKLAAQTWRMKRQIGVNKFLESFSNFFFNFPIQTRLTEISSDFPRNKLLSGGTFYDVRSGASKKT